MQLNQIFEKPVDRPIEGVIKADDDESLQTEIDEYVLTQEVEKRLESFFDAYNNYQGANGVWISGFFGSGKSHLLKMLSHLLASDGNSSDILKSFLEKTEGNTFLSAEMKKAVRLPSQSILFNIDQKADVISKEEFDALLSVFVKVFNEMQGYFGKQGHIAQFERELDGRGIYDEFKAAYEQIADKSWERGREESLLEGTNIARAYAAVTDAPESAAENILDKYRADYRVSIEDFAEMVNDYIEQQEPNFRLNFFVDEVGQYIADNVKLMTNLQTIAESLATKCDGRAWLIVTAQEEMDTVVGEMGKQQTNDFSKIQDRFNNRMKLTSADVAEVIQKRLLAKKEAAEGQLVRLYDREVNNLNTLFDFSDGTDRYSRFDDQEHFVNSYPFIPYQFDLFQSAIQNLSGHNAFEGKHSSVGERSMLAVFQQVVIQIGDQQIGDLATFDLMFEGIRNSLKTSIQQAILTAEKQLDNRFAVRVLKALFLVKYVKEFNATEYNLTVLMTESFDQDIKDLRKQVKEALNVLEQQTYIQRNGDIYEYLTDEEKDIEQEIKNTEVSFSKSRDELGQIIFDSVIGETKISYDDIPQPYPFTRRLDDEPFKSKTYELAINVITPYHQHAGQRDTLISRRMGENELLIILPPDDRVMRDLKLYVQTEKYVNQTLTGTAADTRNAILRDKQRQNANRRSAIKEQVHKLMAEAEYIVGGSEVEKTGSDPKSNVIKGFHQLIRNTYTNLKMLGDRQYKASDISDYLTMEDDMFGATEMSEAEKEIKDYVTLQHGQGKRITLSSLLDRFTRKPYGWYQAAVLCNVAKLHARAQIEIRRDSNPLEGQELAQALTNSHQYQNLVLAPEEEYSSHQISKLKTFYNEYFDRPPGEDEGKKLARKTKEMINNQIEELQEYVAASNDFPFMGELEPVVEKLRSIAGKPAAFYLNEFLDEDHAGELLDMKYDYIAPITSFVNGDQFYIYKKAREFLTEERANFETVDYDTALQVKQTLDDPLCFRGDTMRRVKEQVEELDEKIEERLQEARDEAIERINDRREQLKNNDKFAQLNSMQQESLLDSFDETINEITNFTVISAVKQHAQRFTEETWTDILTQMDEWLEPESQASGDDEEQVVVTPDYIRRSEIRVRFEKFALEDEGDVDAYLAKLKEAYLKEIRDGKRIQL